MLAGSYLIDLDERLHKYEEIIKSGETNFIPPQDEGEEIPIIANVLQAQPTANPIERSVSALLAFHNRHAVPEEQKVPEVEEIIPGRVNLFSKVAFSAFLLLAFCFLLLTSMFITPGHTQFTSTSGASSFASPIVIAIIPAFDIPYGT